MWLTENFPSRLAILACLAKRHRANSPITLTSGQHSAESLVLLTCREMTAEPETGDPIIMSTRTCVGECGCLHAAVGVVTCTSIESCGPSRLRRNFLRLRKRPRGHRIVELIRTHRIPCKRRSEDAMLNVVRHPPDFARWIRPISTMPLQAPHLSEIHQPSSRLFASDSESERKDGKAMGEDTSMQPYLRTVTVADDGLSTRCRPL